MNKIKGSVLRLEWMDILRGLLILSVVIGHATGAFNQYIYQFHMGAFFIVSGFTANPERRSVPRTIYHRFCTTYLPLLSAVILFAGISFILSKTGLYGFFFAESSVYIGLKGIFREFLLRGSIWVWWLGAAWFVLVLFGASLINRIALKLFDDRYGLPYFLVSAAIFLFGYQISKSGGLAFSADLMLIAQGYIMLGTFGKKFLGDKIGKEKWFVQLLGLVVTGGLMFVATKLSLSMDMSARRLNFPLVDVLLSVNGLAFCYFAAALIGRGKVLKKVFSFLGKNTLPIVFFHFVGFKLGYGILYLCKIVPSSYFQNFTPTAEIGNVWWWMLTLVSIGASLLVWLVVMKIPFVPALFGQDKDLYHRLWAWGEKTITGIRQRMTDPTARLAGVMAQVRERMEHICWKKVCKAALLVLLVLVLIFGVMAPFVLQGITLNDEVQAYEARKNGFFALILRNARIELSQGRPTRIMAALNHALSFLFRNIYLSKVVQMFWMLAAVAALCLFIYKIGKNKKFAFFVGLVYLVTYPITFEHTPPNAFNGLTFIPMAELFLALSLYYTYLETRKKAWLWATVGTMTVALFGYEFIVTYMPLFPLLYLLQRKEERSIKNAIKAFVIAGSLAVGYLALMFIGQRIFPVHYDGAKMEFTSIDSILRVIGVLFRSAIPGYWLSHERYDFLVEIYEDQAISRFAIVVPVLLFALLLICFGKKKETAKPEKSRTQWESLLILLVALAYMVIPTMPNALSSLYQQHLDENNFTALPVTAYQYGASCFLICSLVWLLIKRFSSRLVKVVVALCLCALTFNIQSMNITLAQEQHRNSDRLTTAETLFLTNSMKTIQGKTVYSGDLYKTHNALAVTGDYWETMARAYGIPQVEFVAEAEKVASSDLQLYETGHHEWTLVEGKNITVFSKTRLVGQYALHIGGGEVMLVQCQDFTKEAGWYVYHFQLDPVEISPEAPPAN